MRGVQLINQIVNFNHQFHQVDNIARNQSSLAFDEDFDSCYQAENANFDMFPAKGKSTRILLSIVL